MAVTCPTVNSYKRLIRRGAMSGSTWAPVFISYGRNNRTHMLRVPTKSPRVESRAVDASVNAYLGAALVLAAGLEGIERELDPGPPIDRDMYVQSDEQIAELGVELLPRTLAEAIDAFEADPLTLDVFGPDLHAGLHRLQALRVGRLPQHRQPVGVGALPDLLLALRRRRRPALTSVCEKQTIPLKHSTSGR